MKIEGEGLKYDQIVIKRENLSQMLEKLGLPLPFRVFDKQGLIKQKLFEGLTEENLQVLKQIFIQDLVSHDVVGMGWLKPFVYRCLGLEDPSENKPSVEILSQEKREQIINEQIERYYQAPRLKIDQLRRQQYIESLTDFLSKIINLANAYLLNDVSMPLSLSDVIYPVNKHGITLRGLAFFDEIVYKISGQQFNLFDEVSSLNNFFSNPNDQTELDKAFKALEKKLKESNLTPSKRLDMQQLRELRTRSNTYFQ